MNRRYDESNFFSGTRCFLETGSNRGIHLGPCRGFAVRSVWFPQPGGIIEIQNMCLPDRTGLPLVDRMIGIPVNLDRPSFTRLDQNTTRLLARVARGCIIIGNAGDDFFRPFCVWNNLTFVAIVGAANRRKRSRRGEHCKKLLARHRGKLRRIEIVSNSRHKLMAFLLRYTFLIMKFLQTAPVGHTLFGPLFVRGMASGLMDGTILPIGFTGLAEEATTFCKNPPTSTPPIHEPTIH